MNEVQWRELLGALARVDAVLPALQQEWELPTPQGQVVHEDIPTVLHFIRGRLAMQERPSESPAPEPALTVPIVVAEGK